MSQFEKLLIAVLSGRRDSNIAFSDLQKLLELLGRDIPTPKRKLAYA